MESKTTAKTTDPNASRPPRAPEPSPGREQRRRRHAKMKRKAKLIGLKLELNKDNSSSKSWKVDSNDLFTHNKTPEISVGPRDVGLTTPDYKAGALMHKSIVQDFSNLKLTDVELGSGNSGFVRKAIYTRTCCPEHNGLEIPVALKSVRIGAKADRHQVMKEIQTLYQANCANLVDFYGAFYEESTIHIALELMDVGSLKGILGRTTFVPESALCSIATNILGALMYLHGQRLQVHRDIKPSNIVLNSSGIAKLTDFGIVAQLQSSAQMTKTMCGTYTYMSPERIRGEEYNSTADIWSFGLVLYECAVGKCPYDLGGGVVQLCLCIEDMPAPSLPDTGPQKYSTEFIEVIDQCLMKDPKKRLSVDKILQTKWITGSQGGASVLDSPKEPPARAPGAYGPFEVVCWLEESGIIKATL